MKKEPRYMRDDVLNRTLKILGILILASVFLYMLTLLSPFWSALAAALWNVLIPVAMAWLISLIVFPVVRLLERRGVGPRAVSVGIVYVLTIGVLVAFFQLIVPVVTQQVRVFFEKDYPLIIDYFQNRFRDDFVFGRAAYDFFAAAVVESAIISRSVEFFATSLTAMIPTTVFAVIVIFAILPMLLLFYMLDYERVNYVLKTLIPKRYKLMGRELSDHLSHTVGAYIRGQLFLMVALGLVATLAYRLIGLEYFLIFGILVGLANVVPYFGVLIAMIPIATYAYITRDVGPTPLLIIGINVFLQFVEGNVFQPIIMGRQLDLHPLIIIVSILFFGSLFGLLGIVFASPIAATVRVLYGFYHDRKALLDSSESLVESGHSP